MLSSSNKSIYRIYNIYCCQLKFVNCTNDRAENEHFGGLNDISTYLALSLALLVRSHVTISEVFYVHMPIAL